MRYGLMGEVERLNDMLDDCEVELEAVAAERLEYLEHIETLEKFIYDTCKSWPTHLPDPKRVRNAAVGSQDIPH